MRRVLRAVTQYWKVKIVGPFHFCNLTIYEVVGTVELPTEISPPNKGIDFSVLERIIYC